jgi:hypothetical protein
LKEPRRKRGQYFDSRSVPSETTTEGSFDLNSPYTLVRGGRVMEAIEGIRLLRSSPQKNRRLAQLYLVMGMESALVRLLESVVPSDRPAMLSALEVQVRSAPGHLFVGRHERNTEFEHAVLGRLRREFDPDDVTASGGDAQQESSPDSTSSDQPDHKSSTGISVATLLTWEVLPLGLPTEALVEPSNAPASIQESVDSQKHEVDLAVGRNMPRLV